MGVRNYSVLISSSHVVLSPLFFLLLIDFYIAPEEVNYSFLACANIPPKIFLALVRSLTLLVCILSCHGSFHLLLLRKTVRIRATCTELFGNKFGTFSLFPDSLFQQGSLVVFLLKWGLPWCRFFPRLPPLSLIHI